MTAILIFVGFVLFLLWLSWFLGKKAKSAESFFVAGGQIHWFINGIALTGGYLSAASFLGICGMIAFKGFDGYLYSIGFLSGWIVALFVVAEPLRKLGKYTFADALGSRFESKTIHLAAGISTLVICMCYLVPQMVGAGVLIEPLLGLKHHWGVILVGTMVIIIVASAGMSSTTYVQFIKAAMLITFSGVLVVVVCIRGLETIPDTVNSKGEKVDYYQFRQIPVDTQKSWEDNLAGTGYVYLDSVKLENEAAGQDAQTWVLLNESVELQKKQDEQKYHIIRRGQQVPADELFKESFNNPDETQAMLKGWWLLDRNHNGGSVLREAQDITKYTHGVFINDLPENSGVTLSPMGRISQFGTNTGHSGQAGPIGPLKMLSVFADPGTTVELPKTADFTYNGSQVTLYYHSPVAGNELMRPGGHFDISAGNTWHRLDFISLMIALFFGTAALPHVLIRYYTVPDSTAARRSTIVAISAIGLFYILTLFLGLGAIANGVLNPQTDNMSAPLLARSFGGVLFAIITALAFATVLGTVSGLIVAASGAVANDLLDRFMKRSMTEKTKVLAAKLTAVTVGVLAVILGILFKGVNVGFLVGWAFAVAASANFPAIIMVLFWKRTTAAGIISSIFVGIIVSLGIIMAGPDMFKLYGLSETNAWIPMGQPAIISMPLSLLTLIIVSLMTSNKKPAEARLPIET
jgi:cation/acetate symporter